MLPVTNSPVGGVTVALALVMMGLLINDSRHRPRSLWIGGVLLWMMHRDRSMRILARGQSIPGLRSAESCRRHKF